MSKLSPSDEYDINKITSKVQTTSIPVIIYILLVLVIGSIIFLAIDRIILDNDIKLIARMILVCLIINVVVFTFISTSFRVVKIKQGIIGPQGLNGSKGDEGVPGRCVMCEPQPNTFGIEQHKVNADNLVIPQKPLLTQFNSDDNSVSYYFLINKIFKKIIGCRENIVSTESEALLLLDTIKTEMNIHGRLPTESEIISYLKKIKDNADKGSHINKSINYPICYGVNYN